MIREKQEGVGVRVVRVRNADVDRRWIWRKMVVEKNGD